MARVQCAFCGLPFNVRQMRENVEYFCCSGCALASRIPVHEGQLPVSPALIGALAIGFALFNEFLFAALGAAVVAEGRAEAGERLVWVSLALGAILLVAQLVLLAAARTRRWTDLLAAAVALGCAGMAGYAWQKGAPVPAAGYLLLSNFLCSLWHLRGWFRRAWQRRRSPAG